MNLLLASSATIRKRSAPGGTKKQTTSKELYNRTVGKIEFNDSIVIGRGLSTVFPGIITCNDGTISCAVKRILKEKGESTGVDDKKVLEMIKNWHQFCNDSQLLGDEIQELPIVKFYGYEEDLDFWYLISLKCFDQCKRMKFILFGRYIACERFDGNLSQFLRGEEPFESPAFEEQHLYQTSRLQDVISLAEQAAKGLEFIHKKTIYKDIKASKFVVRRGEEGEPKWVCKLADLGSIDPNSRYASRDWISPEMLVRIQSLMQDGSSNVTAVNRLPFNKRSDVWAMGCVLHFIFTGGQHPYGETMKERLDNIPNCQPLITGRTVLVRMSRTQFRPDLLIAEMIQRDPYRRPAMEAVVQRIQEWQLSSDKELKPFISPDLSFQVARSTNWTSLFYVVLLLMVQCLLVYIYYYSLRSN